ncbi:MAG: hypothetical protein R3208_14620 [Ketobacteraceae bacterium]|nr:hypothetical protein [Ketobacteraceae bacterium]
MTFGPMGATFLGDSSAAVVLRQSAPVTVCSNSCDTLMKARFGAPLLAGQVLAERLVVRWLISDHYTGKNRVAD